MNFEEVGAAFAEYFAARCKGFSYFSMTIFDAALVLVRLANNGLFLTEITVLEPETWKFQMCDHYFEIYSNPCSKEVVFHLLLKRFHARQKVVFANAFLQKTFIRTSLRSPHETFCS